EAEAVDATAADAEVAGEDDDEAAGDGMAVHRRDRRKTETVEAADEAVDRHDHRPLLLGAVGRDNLQVEPGREELGVAGEHDGLCRGIRFEAGERPLERRRRLELDRVGGRTHEADERDAVRRFDADHGSRSMTSFVVYPRIASAASAQRARSVVIRSGSIRRASRRLSTAGRTVREWTRPVWNVTPFMYISIIGTGIVPPK